MDKVDQFESAFRSASKDVFHYRPFSVSSVLIVTDLSGAAAERFGADVRALTAPLDERQGISYTVIEGQGFDSPQDLLGLVDRQNPDLVATYRCLHTGAWQWAVTLGAHIDVLTQATDTPVMLLPHPVRTEGDRSSGGDAMPGTPQRVMAVTDHLSGDQRLVNAALSFLEPDGSLFLSHVEDDAVFERYLGVISRIPEIDTELARERIGAQLLKEPADYIRSVSEALREVDVACSVEALISMGHHVRQYRELIESHEIDLLVMNTKDEDQSAMHGLAYPLVVELRDIPLLIL